MAMPIDSAFYVQPNTISDLTLWKDGVQNSITQEISGDYILCHYSGQAGIGILKATGYEDAEVELYDGHMSYITMIPEPEINYVSNLSDGTTTYTIKDAEARSSIANKQDTLVSGTNIKTINGTSILGSGNIPFPTVEQTYNALSTNAMSGIAVANAIDSRIQIVNSAEYANITPVANVIYFITD